MTKPISRFFAPRIAVTSRSNQENGSNKSKARQVKLQKDGWQIPIGLTANDAIEIDDSDDEHQQHQMKQQQLDLDLDMRVPRKREPAIVLSQNDPSTLNPKQHIKPSARTPEQKDRSACSATRNKKESIVLHGHDCVHKTSPKSTNVHAHTDGVINLCSPDPNPESTTVQNNPSTIPSASQTEPIPNSIQSRDNIHTINSNNPFLEFANMLEI